eukprot:TRINITY_DN4463_c0_g1::TRINITY_DN4463_c0_g1_i1::g.7365::m.7365 TRINITY_DN4463_c0_g1::TRINITY_DN4463_c0_g1_i1::g.7365  ORF type:complete len:953 (-),score=201.61,sp/Q61555/FBN2_MOUSE/37.79/6e-29,sp/Q61555/FBN2_MOUSE/40.35/1e-28,sp/Q61555/FBN2_MOUSE/43.75/2e-27,sp/Q61555/FBN2_MOUSE/35.96/9e-27,sp/Q61555/FBN2_MOUSE/39.35/7e-25,sp/Q61555/FBN2_MOUSE/38.22/1e-24,sp/Q61555/FBN2_MOUSE/38.55/6e-24,sp/Q61555/FBN2_MOUSE/36.48/9e-24,sp/Q61555/FBN2_MOUSE/36.59/1e-21,sp/Q61555/FBN2_MOUSE/40.97/2e-21,sp/Q61555/
MIVLARHATVPGAIRLMDALRFSSSDHTVSTVAGSQFTLLHMASGFDAKKMMPSLCVSPGYQCDVDFTLTLRISASESNGGDSAQSTSQSVGVVVTSYADRPVLDIPATTQTTEDIEVALRVTPILGIDSDISEQLKALTVRFSEVLMTRQASFTGIDFTKSKLTNTIYTLTALGSGFQYDTLISTLSIIPAQSCSLDFSLTITPYSMEANGRDIESTQYTVYVSIASLVDAPLIAVQPSTQTTEDICAKLMLTPTLYLGTDGVLRLHKLLVTQYRTKDILSHVSFKAIATSTSVMNAPRSFTLTYHGGTGFGHTNLIQGWSISPAVQCDADFTIQAQAFVFDTNSHVQVPSTIKTIGILLDAVSDVATMSAAPYTAVSEDMSVLLTLTPQFVQDTDGSDTMRQIMFTGHPLGLSFATLSTFLSFPDPPPLPFTVTASGTGYASRRRVNGLSIVPSPDCDVDFTFTGSVVSTESNGYDVIPSLHVCNIPVLVSAVADSLVLNLATEVAFSSEDVVVKILSTPSLIDTDHSESLFKLTLSRLPMAASFSRIRSSSMRVMDTVTGRYTVTAAGTWFARDEAYRAFSITPISQCDIDFAITIRQYGIEANRRDTNSVYVTMDIRVECVPDLPTLLPPKQATVISEQQSQFITLTPVLGLDTDRSESLSQIVFTHGFSSDMTFFGMDSTKSVFSMNVYTVSGPTTGFVSRYALTAWGVSPPISCDQDFTMTAKLQSMEENSYEGIWSVPAYIPIDVIGLDECASGGHNCDPVATCINTAGSFLCVCPRGYVTDAASVACQDYDECGNVTHNCSPYSTCTNTAGSFTCTCNPGFESDNGAVTCHDYHECDLGMHACEHRCLNSHGSFECVCLTGYSSTDHGLSCLDVDECFLGTHNCHRNGQCLNTQGSFTCSCLPEYHGTGVLCLKRDSRPLCWLGPNGKPVCQY